ncbi:hypothetical protein Y046_4778 [Burkholderia pseudomallei MSHR2990]|uniref:hypothetical protein n=1 Tax=Burkholderia pseudomallei TaxID=28450 RepID=UPI000538ECFD|nr:hypothetical protein [Burkholderia pseudomallei]KGW78552.1 hypothetical protein Y046_4778 [Burkholderia pseudomallei MSHR2990]
MEAIPSQRLATPEEHAAMVDRRQASNHALGAASDPYTLIRIDHLVDGEPAGVAYNLANRCMLVLVDDTGRRHSDFDEPHGLERDDGVTELARSLTEFFRTSVVPERLQGRGWDRHGGTPFSVYDFVLADSPTALKY